MHPPPPPSQDEIPQFLVKSLMFTNVNIYLILSQEVWGFFLLYSTVYSRTPFVFIRINYFHLHRFFFLITLASSHSPAALQTIFQKHFHIPVRFLEKKNFAPENAPHGDSYPPASTCPGALRTWCTTLLTF